MTDKKHVEGMEKNYGGKEGRSEGVRRQKNIHSPLNLEGIFLL
jgi:hypothetical protein